MGRIRLGLAGHSQWCEAVVSGSKLTIYGPTVGALWMIMRCYAI